MARTSKEKATQPQRQIEICKPRDHTPTASIEPPNDPVPISSQPLVPADDAITPTTNGGSPPPPIENAPPAGAGGGAPPPNDPVPPAGSSINPPDDPISGQSTSPPPPPDANINTPPGDAGGSRETYFNRLYDIMTDAADRVGDYGFTAEPGDRWLDLGGNIGAFAVWAASLGCEVLSVEARKFCAAMFALVDHLECLLREIAPKIYERQLEIMQGVEPKWRFGKLFTSSISNFNSASPYHIDAANIPSTVNFILTKRKFSLGGDLSVPDYGATIDCVDSSLIVYPAWRNLHGVTPIRPMSPGGYRNSLVFYPLKAFYDEARRQA